MIIISKQYSFDAAHQLYNSELGTKGNKETFGKCARRHGHTYTLTVTVEGKVMASTGMVLNYFDLDAIVKPYIEDLDHYDLNDVFSQLQGRTTAENMVLIISAQLEEILERYYPLVRLHSVALSETPKTNAIWYNE